MAGFTLFAQQIPGFLESKTADFVRIWLEDAYVIVFYRETYPAFRQTSEKLGFLPISDARTGKTALNKVPAMIHFKMLTTFSKRLLTGFVAIAINAASVATSNGAERPNIIVILADDLGYSDLGCYGGEIPTPHIDALAKGGARFTQMYNSARCCPTRASLVMTRPRDEPGIVFHHRHLGPLKDV